MRPYIPICKTLMTTKIMHTHPGVPIHPTRRHITPLPISGSGWNSGAAAFPQVEVTPNQGDDDQLQATAAFVLGLLGTGNKSLPRELCVELLGLMLPVWADQGPEGGL